eukprot:749384-Hanusia_phi.AAC.1
MAGCRKAEGGNEVGNGGERDGKSEDRAGTDKRMVGKEGIGRHVGTRLLFGSPFEGRGWIAHFTFLTTLLKSFAQLGFRSFRALLTSLLWWRQLALACHRTEGTQISLVSII